ncbi:DotU family type IV / VI secretion system protein [Cupriavidus necator]|uniref:DotU family type IV / VI secretion system protein n=1 Tax=Cupriavidus necator TaxID=106590 RepID=A0A1U9UNM4_CUPNE|nr:DotU/TssL family secretion system protein [Cupriavidus necator]AQV93821.1 DotU family type IV / VI secretion system protein [Cupriavidus necator]
MMIPLALRDTALTIAGLADAAQAPDFAAFRTNCLNQVKRLQEELRASGQPADVVEDAAYAQCALLDEVALNRLQGDGRDAWERAPLQVDQFESHDAGDALITRIERRLAEPQPVLPLLAVFQSVLGLGFQGRYALDGANARIALMRAIDERLHRAGVHPGGGPVLVTASKPRRRLGHLSPLGWLALAIVGAGLVYIALDRWLALAIGRLAG